jgi:hypothetical protein
MKEWIVLTALLLSACAPQVTVTSEVTVTLLPASPTPEATSTPEPITTSTAETVSDAMQQAKELVETYKLDGKVTVTEKDNVVSVIDNETGKVLIKSNGIQSWFAIGFAADTIAAVSCESTPFKPRKSGRMPGEYGKESTEYLMELEKELKYSGGEIFPVLLNSEKQCWAFADSKNLLYRDEFGVAQKLPLIVFTEEEKAELLENRASR